MMIKDLFKQDVNREIETVVKAADTRNIDSEIIEYVITNEVSRKIGDLFSSYGDSNTINGVWIHGFFGSGKSHLLKMLSYVFGNYKLSNGMSAADVFASKAKDEFIKGDIHRVSQIPSESILFNIDDQATISNNENKNSVLLVFYKVFYDHLGFYGTQPHMAEFEWWLRFRKNIYEEFKEEFFKITNRDWTSARRDFYDPDVTDAASEALAKLLDRDEGDFETILENIEAKQSLSVEDFSNRVSEYIKTKKGNFHLNFFIDEVGQFIAGDISLMLNLQTVVEGLASKTNNKSWVFATAQSSIEGLGDDIKQTQDYARILGRFRMQINLTSANVDEVIEKRLLDKKEDKISSLVDIYKKEKSLINTLISSSDNRGMPVVAYRDEDDFVMKYPFLFYQFSLFQECRTTLAGHDVFQGKHASVGERSMLGVFQAVLKDIENDAILTIPSFDKMYKGIENDLRAEFVTSINNAETNLNDDFAIKVLKTLFLVKYYKQFLATKENIAMLLIDNIHINTTEHQNSVNKALAKLEHHSYIERNGDLYEFLTNKEKDIETEIKNTSIDENNVSRLLKELFFDEVLGRSRIRYEDNKQDYDYVQKLDGVMYGREKELSVEIITPNYEGMGTRDELKGQTMGLPVLRLVTNPNGDFISDVRMFLKVQRYNSINQTNTVSNETRSILFQKLSDNAKRKESLLNRANEMLGSAAAYVNGNELDVNHRVSGKDYVSECFQHLIKVFYPNLRMLGDTSYTEDTFRNVITGVSMPGLFDDGDASISEAESQILNYVERRKNQHERTSIYDIKNNFSRKPFGWYSNATFTIIAKLFKKNKIEVTDGENPLDNRGLITTLINSAQHDRTFVIAQVIYSSGQVKNLKELYRDLFDRGTSYNDAKDIAIDFKDRLKEMSNDVKGIIARKSEFPFTTILQPLYEEAHKWSNKSYKDIIEHMDDIEDTMLDIKEDDYDVIKQFINSEQGRVYKNIRDMVNGNTANINHVDGEEYDNLKKFLSLDKPYLGDALQKAESERKSLFSKLEKQVREKRENAINEYKNELEDLKGHPEIQKLALPDLERLLAPITKKISELERERFIGNFIASLSNLPSLVSNALNSAAILNAKHITPTYTKEGGDIPNTNNEPVPTPIKYVNKSKVNIPFDKNELTTEEDVRAYVKTIEQIYLNHIKENKRIRL